MYTKHLHNMDALDFQAALDLLCTLRIEILANGKVLKNTWWGTI